MKHKLLAIVPLLLMLGAWRPADAQRLPYDYTVTTPDGQYVFVMLGIPYPTVNLRLRYDHSGLYRNDGSATPLWTVDWYAPSVEISADGQYLVALERRFIIRQQDGAALAFYERGQQIASYQIDQLVTFALLPPSHAICCQWQTGRLFDDKQGRLTVVTRDGEQIVFDVKTGQVISGFVPPISRWLILVGALLLAGLLIAYLGVVFRRNPWRDRLITTWAVPRPLI